MTLLARTPMFLHFKLLYSGTVVWLGFLNFVFSVFHIYPGKIDFFNLFFFFLLLIMLERDRVGIWEDYEVTSLRMLYNENLSEMVL